MATGSRTTKQLLYLLLGSHLIVSDTLILMCIHTGGKVTYKDDYEYMRVHRPANRIALSNDV